MPDPVPYMHQFTAGDSFDDPEVRDKLRDNILSISLKFGALTTDDVAAAGMTFTGPVDIRNNSVSNISEAGAIINMEEQTDDLQTVVDNARTGSVILLPPHFTYAVSGVVTWRDGVHLVGCGISSVLLATTNAGTAAGYDMFYLNGISKCSFRNFRAGGKRTFHTSGRFMHVHNCRDADIVLENLVLGPVLGQGVTNAFDGTVLDIHNSSGIFATNLLINQCSSTGIFMHSDTSTSLVERVDIKDCHIHDTQNAGIEMDDARDVRVSGCNIGNNRATNVIIYASCSQVMFHDNHMYNSGTGFAGTLNNLLVTGGNGNMVLCNHMREKKSKAKTTGTQIDTSGGNYHTVYGNHLGQVTGTANPVIADGSTGSTRDGNHVHDAYYRVVPYGATGSVDQLATSRAPASDWSTTYAENYANKKPAYVSSVPYTTEYRPGQAQGGVSQSRHRSVWSDSGDVADVKEIELPEAVELMGNKGSALTPNNFHSDSTHVESETAAIHATYNIVEPFPNAQHKRSDGTVSRSGGPALYSENAWLGQNENPIREWRDWWNAADASGVGGTSGGDPRNSVLNAYFDAGTTLFIAGHTAFRDGVAMAHRPTWVRMHL